MPAMEALPCPPAFARWWLPTIWGGAPPCRRAQRRCLRCAHVPDANGGGVVALRDTKGDGRFDTKQYFGSGSTTGIALHNGYLYLATPTSVERYKMTPGQLSPPGSRKPSSGASLHSANTGQGNRLRWQGSLYINFGAPSNACQSRDRRPKSPGQDPCPHARKARWRLEVRREQAGPETGGRHAVRHRPAPDARHHLARRRALHRDEQPRPARHRFAPACSPPQENAERPAEPMYRVEPGSTSAGPIASSITARRSCCSIPNTAATARPRAVAPNSASHRRFPGPLGAGGRDVLYRHAIPGANIRSGAFIAFHGSWNRSPMPQEGYNVTFQPFVNGNPRANSKSSPADSPAVAS